MEGRHHTGADFLFYRLPGGIHYAGLLLGLAGVCTVIISPPMPMQYKTGSIPQVRTRESVRLIIRSVVKIPMIPQVVTIMPRVFFQYISWKSSLVRDQPKVNMRSGINSPQGCAVPSTMKIPAITPGTVNTNTSQPMIVATTE